MNYDLRFSINYDEVNWDQETYREEKKKYLLKLIEKYPNFNGRYLEGYEHVQFPNGSPELVQILKNECGSKGFSCDIGTFPIYSKEEIRNARYVPFGSGGRYNRTDCNDRVPFNLYKDKLCDACGICNLDKIPSPYRVSKRILEDGREISSESNGITILSEWVFEELRNEIEPWIVWGDVEIADRNRHDVVKHKYIWIRPIHKVGAYVDAKVLQKCQKCGRPTEIRKPRSEDIFGANKEVVESFRGVKAPIVLPGNWFGEIVPGGIGDVSRNVFISGMLHDKIRKMKLKAFCKADYVIHAADEPYDWDPLKNRPHTMNF